MKSSEIILIVDRSGSMAFRDYGKEMEVGINQLIADQIENNQDDCRLTIVQFDTEIEFVCENKKIAKAKKYHLEPRGGTALLDAIGIAVRQRQTQHKIEGKPDLTMVCIVTDGQENSSREWNYEAVKELVQKRIKKGWKFTFMGANMDAFSTGVSIGLSTNATANFTQNNTTKVYTTVSGKMGQMRSSSAAGHTVGDFTYDSCERKDLTDD